MHLFAGLAEAVGSRSLKLPVEGGTLSVQELKRLLANKKPDLKLKIEQCMVAVNHEYAENETSVSPDDEVVFIPPVSGG